MRAVLADPPDDEDDYGDDCEHFESLHDHDPHDYPAHVAHITVSALSSGLAKAFLAAAVAALVIRGALRVDRRAFETRVVFLTALHVSTATIRGVGNCAASLAFITTARTSARILITDPDAALRVGEALLALKKAVSAKLTLCIARPGATGPLRTDWTGLLGSDTLVRLLTIHNQCIHSGKHYSTDKQLDTFHFLYYYNYCFGV